MHANLMPSISYWGDTCHLDQGFDGSRCACGSWGSHKLTPTEPGASRPGGVGFFLTLPPTRVSTRWRIIKSGIDCVISARAHGGSLFCVAGAHSSPFWRAQRAIFITQLFYKVSHTTHLVYLEIAIFAPPAGAQT